MKLPDETVAAYNATLFDTASQMLLVETIVRDCAKVCGDGILVADVRVGSEQFAKAILTRYSLEPKP